MTTYVHPERVRKGQLLWLEIEELQGVKVACRVFAVFRGFRAQVEILASDHTLVSVCLNRLFEEST
jgi:hypothetical protein